jgi:hypothetical protein
MTTQEAKFLLSAYRPDGRDAVDPFFAEALAQARSDPELASWFAREQALDARVAEKLGGIAPPHGLRESILAGARASQPRRGRWMNPVWLAAACIAILLSVAIGLRLHGAAPTESDLARFALRDLAEEGAEHEPDLPSLASVQAGLSSHPLPIYKNLRFDPLQLRQDHCRAITVAGHEVFEICFKHGGSWYHLYIARMGDFEPSAPVGTPTFVDRNLYAAAAWTDGQATYALVTDAGPAALRLMFGS